MSGEMKRLKMKMEVQEIPFNYFTRPQPRDLNFYVMMIMAIQKNIVVCGFKIVVGICDGLDACEDFPAWNFAPVAPVYMYVCYAGLDINFFAHQPLWLVVLLPNLLATQHFHWPQFCCWEITFYMT